MRLGSFNLLLDFQADLFEVNGKPIRWFGRTSGDVNPLDGLGADTPLLFPENPGLEGLSLALRRFMAETPPHPQWVSLRLLSGATLVWTFLARLLEPLGSHWWTWRMAWEIKSLALLPIFLLAGLALQAMALRVRGLSSPAYGLLWWTAMAVHGHPYLGIFAIPLVSIAALSRVINPWLGVGGLLVLVGPREGVLLLALPWIAMAAYLSLQETRRSGRRLEVLPDSHLSDLSRGAEALSKSRIWRQKGTEPLLDAFSLRAAELTVVGGSPIWFLESGPELLCFLPGALLWIRPGIGAELVPIEAVRIHSQACHWEDSPEELDLGTEQWMIRLQVQGRPGTWNILVAEALWGRRAAAAWARVLTEATLGEGPTGSMPFAPQVMSAEKCTAYRILGLRPGASQTQVRDAYLRLAKSFHPDAHPEAPPAVRAEYEARMRTINEAYSKLKEEAA